MQSTTDGTLSTDELLWLTARAEVASAVEPVTREHLRREAVGPAFIEYLASNWDDFVA